MYHEGELFAGHLPFSQRALVRCKVAEELNWNDENRAGFEEGWSVWNEAQGGYFEISPSEVADLIRDRTEQ